MWNAQMVALLTQLAGSLSETVAAWDEFRRTEIEYFLYDEKPQTASSSLNPSVAAVNKTFSKLRLRLRKLEGLGKELDPQGVSYLSDSEKFKTNFIHLLQRCGG